MNKTLKLDDFRKKVNLVCQVLAGKKPQGLDEYYNKLVFNGSRMYASTHEVGISCGFASEFSGAADARTLTSILSTLVGEEITLEANDATLKITCGETDAQLPLETLEEQIAMLPEESLEGDYERKLAENDTKAFCKLIDQVVSTASEDDPREALRCVHFFVEDDHLTAYASNAFMFARSQNPKYPNPLGDLPTESLAINAFFCRIFADVAAQSAAEHTTLRISDSYVQAIRGEGENQIVVQAGLLDEDHAMTSLRDPYNRAISALENLPQVDVPALLEPLVSQAKILSHDKIYPHIELAVSNKLLIVRSGQLDLKGTMKSRPIKIDHADTTARVSPDYLLRFLEKLPTKITISPDLIVMFVETETARSTLLTATAV